MSDVVNSANDGMKYRQSVNEITTATIHNSSENRHFTMDEKTPQLTVQYKHRVILVQCGVSDVQARGTGLTANHNISYNN